MHKKTVAMTMVDNKIVDNYDRVNEWTKLCRGSIEIDPLNVNNIPLICPMSGVLHWGGSPQSSADCWAGDCVVAEFKNDLMEDAMVVYRCVRKEPDRRIFHVDIDEAKIENLINNVKIKFRGKFQESSPKSYSGRFYLNETLVNDVKNLEKKCL